MPTPYMQDIRHHPRISQDETAALAERARAGDREARNAIVSGNLALVITAAKRWQNKGLTWDELISIGNMGLIRAAELYDPQVSRFSTYANRWIDGTIQHELRINRLIHTGRREGGKLYAAKAKAAYCTVLESEFAPYPNSPKSPTLDSFSDDRNPPESRDWVDVLDQGMKQLSPRERTILRLRFGLGKLEGSAIGSRQIGKRLGVGYERVRQLKKHSLAILKYTLPQLEDQLA